MTVGFDKRQLNHQLAMALPFFEYGGARTYSIDPSHVANGFALNGPPVWLGLVTGVPILQFNPANPDFLDASAADSVVMDITTEDFSMVVWAILDNLAVARMLLCRGLLDTDGWFWQVDANGAIHLVTNQAAANQDSYSANGVVTTGNWYLLGATRSGSSVKVYRNGVDVTLVADTHIDPLTSARELHVGIYDDEVSNPFDGNKWFPRVWVQRELIASDMLDIFESERHWFRA